MARCRSAALTALLCVTAALGGAHAAGRAALAALPRNPLPAAPSVPRAVAAAAKERAAAKNNIYIAVYVTIALKEEDDLDDVTDSQIWRQMQVLKDGFNKNAPDIWWNFDLKGIRRIAMDYVVCDNLAGARALGENRQARGSKKTLNIFVVDDAKDHCKDEGELGFSTYPDKSAGADDDVVLIRRSTLPGGNSDNPGTTAPHEVGHFMGLDHIPDGDDVADSCENGPGKGNFMAYGGCRWKFEPWQQEKMLAAWHEYRA